MKKNPSEFHIEPWDQDFYGTGSTQPPKNHGSIIAGLLIAVIVLGGITTVLGIMNVRLFRMLEMQKQAENNLQLIQPQETGDTEIPESVDFSGNAAALGIECATVSDFDAKFYSLPYGCLVTRVAEEGCSDKAGLFTGDVIVSFNDRSVTTVEELAGELAQCRAGQQVTVVVYRSRTNRHVTLEVTLDEKGE